MSKETYEGNMNVNISCAIVFLHVHAHVHLHSMRTRKLLHPRHRFSFLWLTCTNWIEALNFSTWVAFSEQLPFIWNVSKFHHLLYLFWSTFKSNFKHDSPVCFLDWPSLVLHEYFVNVSSKFASLYDILFDEFDSPSEQLICLVFYRCSSVNATSYAFLTCQYEVSRC